MVTIIIFILIGICFGIYRATKCWSPDGVDYIFGFIFGGILGLFVGFTIALLLPAHTTVKETIYKLEALQDGNSTSGHFFLGSGHFEGKMQYVFYYEYGGYYQLMQVDHERAKIKFSNHAIVRRFKTEKTNAIINKFAIDFCPSTTYIFEVPNGSIIQQYQLDAK